LVFFRLLGGPIASAIIGAMEEQLDVPALGRQVDLDVAR
jgi:hypothetical protein